jgi:hypothetical protein
MQSWCGRADDVPVSNGGVVDGGESTEACAIQQRRGRIQGSAGAGRPSTDAEAVSLAVDRGS